MQLKPNFNNFVWFGNLIHGHLKCFSFGYDLDPATSTSPNIAKESTSVFGSIQISKDSVIYTNGKSTNQLTVQDHMVGPVISDPLITRGLVDGKTPLLRNRPAVAYNIYKEQLVLFGGGGGMMPLSIEITDQELINYPLQNDLWLLDLSGDKVWRSIIVAYDRPSPSPRTGHIGVIDQSKNYMIIHGGTTSDKKVTTETWVLNLQQTPPVWSLMSTTGLQVAKTFHTALSLKDRRIIVTHGTSVNETRKIDSNTHYLEYTLSGTTSSGEWKSVNIAGTTKPPDRTHHAAVLRLGSIMVIFGGIIHTMDAVTAATAATAASDTWILDMNGDFKLDTFEWKLLQPTVRPNVRSLSGMNFAVMFDANNTIFVGNPIPDVLLILPPVPCGAGYYRSPSGEFSCRKCAYGRFSTPESMSCDYTPSSCPAGTYASIGTSVSACNVCNAGRYAPAPGGLSSCLSCPVGYNLNDDSIDAAHHDEWTDCHPCKKGRHGTVDDKGELKGCVTCEPGRYSSKLGAEVCIACKAGTYLFGSTSTSGTNEEEHDEEVDCKSCHLIGMSLPGMAYCNIKTGECPKGSYQNSTTACTVCPKGQYSSRVGVENCFNCPAGTFLIDELEDDSLLHDDVSKCISCPLGTASPPGSHVCNYCPEGQEADLKDLSLCLPCTRGKFKSKGKERCENCPSGTEGKLNGGVSEETACSTCGAGKFSTMGLAYCLECKSGRFLSDKGIMRVNHVESKACDFCPVGRISQQGAGFCLECSAGKEAYSNYSSNVTTCLDCGVGKKGLVGRNAFDEVLARCLETKTNMSNISMFIENCKGMAAASPASNAVCVHCDAGQVQPTTSQAFCLPCIP